MGSEVLDGLLYTKDTDKKSKEFEIKLIARLQTHKNIPANTAFGRMS